jgi:CheY-like chemotaxis protein
VRDYHQGNPGVPLVMAGLRSHQPEDLGVSGDKVRLLYQPVYAAKLRAALETVLGRTADIPVSHVEEGQTRFRGQALVVEDNRINQRLIRLVLSDLGLDTTVATDGQQAIDKFRQGSFDIVFMDINMPGMDGVEATARIRELEPDCHTPIVALTAHALKGDRERFLSAGMDDYLAQPVERDELEAVLARRLARN